MNYYILRLKSDNSRVDRIQAKNLKEARENYIMRKQLDEKTFDKLYDVSEDTK